MLKKFVLALMPLTLLATAANASDDLDLSNMTAADIEIVEDDLDLDIDLDVMGSEENGTEETALEACFRRINYGRRNWGRGFHNSWGNHWGNTYYNHRHSYRRPLYSHRALTYCPPVYRAVCAPIYSYYWGCH